MVASLKVEEHRERRRDSGISDTRGEQRKTELVGWPHRNGNSAHAL